MWRATLVVLKHLVTTGALKICCLKQFPHFAYRWGWLQLFPGFYCCGTPWECSSSKKIKAKHEVVICGQVKASFRTSLAKIMPVLAGAAPDRVDSLLLSGGGENQEIWDKMSYAEDHKCCYATQGFREGGLKLSESATSDGILRA